MTRIPADSKLPERHDSGRSPDADPHGSLLSNLSLSIGSFISRYMLEAGRAGAPRPTFAGMSARPAVTKGLRAAFRLGTPDHPQVAQPGDQNPLSRTGSSDPVRLGVARQRDVASVAFWEALDAIEREAFRSVAFRRTFAAGARLLREGDQADHVIVILSGRTKICINENGAERVLAQRGPGQLVGERGALQVSVRSASVIAVETVQALVVRTADFAAFITAHPTVLTLVENQLHDRRLSGGPPQPRPQLLNGQNCTVVLSDVAGFGARQRTDEDRRIIREAIFAMTHTVLQGIPDVWSWDDRGDGLLMVIPPSVPTAKVIEHLHRELPVALDEHNRAYHDSARIQLRVAVNVGPVASDSMGVSGEAIIITSRLVEAPLLKQAMDSSGAALGVIASTFIYETVVKHTRDLTGYSQVQVDVKETNVTAWMKLFDVAESAPGDSGAAAA